MMKHFLFLLLAAFFAVTAWAQNEQDFASRFMTLYAKGSSLTCTTVSPLMMERMLQLPSVEDNEQMKQVFSQLKSIRMVSNSDDSESQRFHQLAVKLARRNSARYKLWGRKGDDLLYTRRRGRITVEVVLILNRHSNFYLVDLTGNMNDQFISQLLKI